MSRSHYGIIAITLALTCAAFAQIERPVRLGEDLPPIDVDYVKGAPIHSPDGHTITVVEFWATWCKPCRRTIPHLSELQERYGDRGLQILGISDETREDVRPFVDHMGDQMDYAVAVDMHHHTTNRFREADSPIPRAYLFNELGKLIWIGHPADDGLERLIKELTDELNQDS